MEWKKTKSNRQSAFTLVELLIVVVILIILATIGIALYKGSSARARDVRRIADIKAIANALEVNYNPSVGYMPIQATWFTSGKVPYDPLFSNYHVPYDSEWHDVCGSGIEPDNACLYCNNTRHGVGYCHGSNELGIHPVDGPNPGNRPDSDTQGYILCANLETDIRGSDKYYCEISKRSQYTIP